MTASFFHNILLYAEISLFSSDALSTQL